jgi:hypothetical protein
MTGISERAFDELGDRRGEILRELIETRFDPRLENASCFASEKHLSLKALARTNTHLHCDFFLLRFKRA